MSSERIHILRGMKERLFEKGWVQRDFGGSKGPNCILGALSQTPGAWHNQCDLELILNEECGRVNVVAFNDDVDTTFDDIVDLIDKVIKRLEGEVA